MLPRRPLALYRSSGVRWPSAALASAPFSPRRLPLFLLVFPGSSGVRWPSAALAHGARWPSAALASFSRLPRPQPRYVLALLISPGVRWPSAALASVPLTFALHGCRNPPSGPLGAFHTACPACSGAAVSSVRSLLPRLRAGRAAVPAAGFATFAAEQDAALFVARTNAAARSRRRAQLGARALRGLHAATRSLMWMPGAAAF